MEFEEFFENKRKNQGNFRQLKYHDHNRGSQEIAHSYSENNIRQKWLTILEKIKSSKKLKILVVLAGIVIISIATMLIIVFLPLIIKLINYISQNGLQGLMDAVTGFLDKILKGSAK
jgi:hypothetical protein